MSPLVAGESTTGKDVSLMSFVPHRVQDLKPLDCKCCISQHLQFEAEKSYTKARVFDILPGEKARKQSRLSRKKVTTS